MRTKKSFSFDEERDAEEVVVNGFPNGLIDYGKMYLVAKYLRHNFGYGKVHLERELIKFCKAQDKNFNPIVEEPSLKKWIKCALLYDLRKVDSVIVTQKEIAFLKTIPIEKDRKLIFITLVLSKALKKGNTKQNKTKLKTSDNYYIHYKNLIDVIRLSKINNITEINLADILFKYKEHFLVYNPEKELLRLEFVDKQPAGGIEINNLEKVLDYHELFFGKNKSLGICSRCGKEMIKNSNTQKNCKECSLEIRREQKKEWIKKARQNVVQ